MAAEAACDVHSANVILNFLARRRDPGHQPPEALKIAIAPVADCVRCDQLRNMGRSDQIFDRTSELKLFGMQAAYDEIMASGIKRQHEPPPIIGDMLAAEIGNDAPRSSSRPNLPSAKAGG
jgi:hypothetical protein